MNAWKKVGWVLATVGILIVDLLPNDLASLTYLLSGQGSLAQVVGLIGMVGSVSLIFWLACRNKIFTKDKISVKNLLITLLVGFLVITAFNILGQIVMRLTDNAQMTNQDSIQSTLKLMPIFMIVYGMLVAPVLEEIIFRGYIFKKWFPHHDYWALAVSSILFALLHQGITPGSFIIYGGMSFVFGLAYLYNGKNLKYSIALHLFNNFFALLAMLMMLLG